MPRRVVHVARWRKNEAGQARQLQVLGRAHRDDDGVVGLARLCDAKGVGAHDAQHLWRLHGEVRRERLAEERADAALVLGERVAALRDEAPSCKRKDKRKAPKFM